MAHNFILLWLNPFNLDIDTGAWWFEHSVSSFWYSLPAEDAENVSQPWLSPVQDWGSLTVTVTDKFRYMAHHFILLWFNPLGLTVGREEWWFKHCVSQFCDSLSAKVAENVSWPWLSAVQGSGSLTVTINDKFGYMFTTAQSLWPYSCQRGTVV